MLISDADRAQILTRIIVEQIAIVITAHNVIGYLLRRAPIDNSTVELFFQGTLLLVVEVRVVSACYDIYIGRLSLNASTVSRG